MWNFSSSMLHRCLVQCLFSNTLTKHVNNYAISFFNSSMKTKAEFLLNQKASPLQIPKLTNETTQKKKENSCSMWTQTNSNQTFISEWILDCWKTQHAKKPRGIFSLLYRPIFRSRLKIKQNIPVRIHRLSPPPHTSLPHLSPPPPPPTPSLPQLYIHQRQQSVGGRDDDNTSTPKRCWLAPPWQKKQKKKKGKKNPLLCKHVVKDGTLHPSARFFPPSCLFPFCVLQSLLSQYSPAVRTYIYLFFFFFFLSGFPHRRCSVCDRF